MVPGFLYTSIDEATAREIRAELKAKDFTLRSGDVVLKVDDEEAVDGHIPDIESPQTYTVLRDGKMIVMNTRGAQMTTNTCAWDADKGGNDHYRAMRDLRDKHFPEALARLKAAAASGMDDRWSLGITAMLAAHLGDVQTALACYKRYRPNPAANPSQPQTYRFSCDLSPPNPG